MFHTAQVCSYDRMGLGFSKRLMQNESTGTEKVWGMSTTGRLVYSLFTARVKYKILLFITDPITYKTYNINTIYYYPNPPNPSVGRIN